MLGRIANLRREETNEVVTFYNNLISKLEDKDKASFNLEDIQQVATSSAVKLGKQNRDALLEHITSNPVKPSPPSVPDAPSVGGSVMRAGFSYLVKEQAVKLKKELKKNGIKMIAGNVIPGGSFVLTGIEFFAGFGLELGLEYSKSITKGPNELIFKAINKVIGQVQSMPVSTWSGMQYPINGMISHFSSSPSIETTQPILESDSMPEDVLKKPTATPISFQFVMTDKKDNQLKRKKHTPLIEEIPLENVEESPKRKIR